MHSNLGFTELEDRERQRAGIAPGQTWAGCAGSASSEASQLPQHSQVRAFSSRPLAEARLEQRQQPSGAQAGARGPPRRQLGAPRSLSSCVALLLIRSLLFPRVAADLQVFLPRHSRRGEGLSAGL